MSVKQVIVMRKDLNMRKGKMIAQGSHASMKVFFDRLKPRSIPPVPRIDIICPAFSEEELEWVDGTFTKICVYVNSEAELDDIYNKAKEAKLNCAMIVDSGLTEFNGVATKTCCAIGPNYSDKIDEITGKLPLL